MDLTKKDQQEGSGADIEDLQTEYNTLTETLISLKRKAEQLRKDNEFLQNEAHQTQMETQEYTSYMSKRTQKRQNMIITLSDQNQKELEDLKRQREEMLENYTEKANELRREILEKEKELAQMNLEISELKEFKTLQQQQLDRIAELEQEISDTHLHHSEALHTLNAEFLKEKEHYKSQAKQRLQSFTSEANRVAAGCLLSHLEEVSQENQRLRRELQQLIQKADALHSRQDLLQRQREELLQEREYMRELRLIRTSAQSGSTTPGGTTTETSTQAAATPLENMADKVS